MIEFIICEDEKEIQTLIRNCIKKTMSNCVNPYTISFFEEYTPDLQSVIEKSYEKIYILDIQLKKNNRNGFEIARSIRHIDENSPIIILTVSRNMQGEAFRRRLNILDYIVKSGDCPNFLTRLSESIVISVNKLTKKDEKCLFIFDDRTLVSLSFFEIVYIKRITKTRKTAFITTHGKIHYSTESLSKIEKKLNHLFFRTHQSCIVNLFYLKSVDYDNEILYLKNELPINLLSRDQKKKLKDHLENYL
ncbi:MAG: LytR/AlgR family response regulator transcription factor [Eubacteriaceae bacterium]